jgi:hypothetical protein
MQSRPGSIGGGVKGPRKSKFFQAALTPIKDLLPQLIRLISSQNVPRMLKSLAPEVVQAIAQMANHGIDPDSVACLLLGCVSPNGKRACVIPFNGSNCSTRCTSGLQLEV